MDAIFEGHEINDFLLGEGDLIDEAEIELVAVGLVEEENLA